MDIPPETPRLGIFFLDTDASPAKNETYRVAARYKLKVYGVANSALVVPRAPSIERVAAKIGPDVAGDWTIEHDGHGDVDVTNYLSLASRRIEKVAEVLAPTGKPFCESSIGTAAATRNLTGQLRSAGQTTGGRRRSARAIGPVSSAPWITCHAPDARRRKGGGGLTRWTRKPPEIPGAKRGRRHVDPSPYFDATALMAGAFFAGVGAGAAVWLPRAPMNALLTLW